MGSYNDSNPKLLDYIPINELTMTQQSQFDEENQGSNANEI